MNCTAKISQSHALNALNENDTSVAFYFTALLAMNDGIIAKVSGMQYKVSCQVLADFVQRLMCKYVIENSLKWVLINP